MTVTVIYGGKSGEHEISLVSAAAVARNIDSKNKVQLIAITKTGRWFLQPESEFERIKADSKGSFKIIEDETQEVSVIPGGGSKKTFRVGDKILSSDEIGRAHV